MTHVALWSHSQQGFHVESLAETVANNLRAYVRNRPADYVPVFVGPEQECRDFVNRLAREKSPRAMQVEHLRGMFQTAP